MEEAANELINMLCDVELEKKEENADELEEDAGFEEERGEGGCEI